MIGYGYWGPNLVRNFVDTDSAQVIAISDLDPAKLEICKRLHPGVATTTDANDLLETAE